MAVIKPPGQDGLAGEIAGLRQQINELSRRTNDPTICLVRLNADMNFTSDSQDLIPVTSWSPTADVDPYNTYTYNGTGGTFVTIPWQGRFYVRLHALYRPAQNYSAANIPNSVSAKIMMDAADAANNVIGYDKRWHGPDGLATNLDAIEESRIFTAGQKLFFGFWSRYAGTSPSNTVLKQTTSLDFTHLIVRYLGPS